MRRWVKGAIAGAVTALAGTVFALTPLGADFEKEVGLRWLFKIRGPIEAPAGVAVVAIDDRTGSHIGLPALPRDWPRSIHGRLVERLTARGAAVIVFDLDLQRPKSPTEDQAFADAVAKAGRVVLFQRLNGKRQPIMGQDGRPVGWVWIEQLIPPIPPLADAAKALAPFPVPKVQVNVYQFWAFKPSAGDAPTLPAAALQVLALGAYDDWRGLLAQAGAVDPAELPRHADAVKRAPEVRELMRQMRHAFGRDPLLADKLHQALEQDGRPGRGEKSEQLARALAGLYDGADNRYLNFYGPPGSIPTIPYHAVINGGAPGIDAAALDFTDKVVFVGFSDLYDPGQPDRFYTVFTNEEGVDLSGVEIAATAFGNLLSDRSLRPSGTWTTALILIVFGALMGAGIYLLPAIVGVPVALALAAGYYAAVQYGFNTADYWLPLATPMLGQLPVALFIGLVGQYLLERRQKLRVAHALSYYLPENVARDLTQGSTDSTTLNQVVYGTCLATDMSGFTTISESMDPDALAVFMNDYFDSLAQPLKQNSVTITEFHADTIMCAWTSDKPDIEVRRKAVFAGLDVVEAVDLFSAKHEHLDLNARIGLEEGWFYVGHTGGGGQFAYSILGDCANTASRMEGLNKHVGTHLLATGPVIEGLDGLLLRPVGRFVFVGKSEPTPVVEVLTRGGDASNGQRLLCEQFAEALELFDKAEWSKAAERFEAILRGHPEDGPARFYLSRCGLYATAPPNSEDPSVIHMDSK